MINIIIRATFWGFVLFLISYYTKVEKIIIKGGESCVARGVSKLWLESPLVRIGPVSTGKSIS